MYYDDASGIVFLVTRDAGATWRAVDLPVIQAQQDLHVTAGLALSPELTMFDDADGLLALSVYRSSGPADPALRRLLYVTGTSDGAAHWTPTKLIRLPEPGGVVFLDSKRWMMVSDRRVYFTHDAGGRWQQVGNASRLPQPVRQLRRRLSEPARRCERAALSRREESPGSAAREWRGKDSSADRGSAHIRGTAARRA